VMPMARSTAAGALRAGRDGTFFCAVAEIDVRPPVWT
jgi:hypothetical protein